MTKMSVSSEIQHARKLQCGIHLIGEPDFRS
jgi:hypothetical protein